MKRGNLVVCAVLVISALAVGGCARQSAVELPEPASVEPISGTNLNKIVLTDLAYKNLGIQTAAVRDEAATSTAGGNTARRLVIPMGALVFNPEGEPFAYTSAAPMTYVRAPVVIGGYRGNDVLLVKGPKVGTQVVTVGDPALLGIEYGVGEE